MKRFILKGLFAALVFVSVAEVGARWVLPARFGHGLAALDDYYAPEERIAAAGPVTHMAVGTSQVGAAVDPDTLQALLRASAPPDAHRRIRVVNAAKGYSTQMQHYLGLRNLIARHPTSMEGVVVFLEAPDGVADYQTEDDPWANENWPSLLGPLLRVSDLPRFYLHANNTVADKARVTAAHFLYTARYLRDIRIRLEAAVNAKLAPPRATGAVDLSTRAGIRTDRAGVALARAEATQVADERREAALAAGDALDWDRSVFAAIVRLVRAHGGDAVFFATPQSPVMEERWEGAMEVQRRTFEAWTQANHIAVLYPEPFTYGAEDFPDNIHLRNSRSGEYTARLAEAYLAWARGHRAAPTPAPAPAPAQ